MMFWCRGVLCTPTKRAVFKYQKFVVTLTQKLMIPFYFKNLFNIILIIYPYFTKNSKISS